jgi:hypothetical protein
VQQNFWVDPPVVRGVNVRPHHRQQSSRAGFWADSSPGVTDPLPQFPVIAVAEFDDLGNCSTTPKVYAMTTIYSYKAIGTIYNPISPKTGERLHSKFECRSAVNWEFKFLFLIGGSGLIRCN